VVHQLSWAIIASEERNTVESGFVTDWQSSLQRNTAALGARVAQISSITPEQVEAAFASCILFENHLRAHEVSPAELQSFPNKHFAETKT
jgi:hypothetical protein